MQTTLKKLENCKTEATVVLDEEMWTKAIDKATKKATSQVQIKGFRKGHAPEEMAKRYINTANVLNDALDDVLSPVYVQVLNENKIQPFAQPKVNVTKISEKECEVVFTIVTRPEIELGAYKGLAIGHQEVSVSDEELEKEIHARLVNQAELVLKEGLAEKGDTAVIDFEGFVDGVAFEGGKAENYSLELGSGTFIPGFEDQIIGHKAEEEFDVKVTFPEEYPVDSLKGKEAIFKTKLHEVKTKEIPELNEDLVKEMEIKDVETVDAFKEFVKNDLMSKKQNEEDGRYYEALIAEIVKNSKVDIASEIIDEEVNAMYDNFVRQVEQNGLDMEQYYQLTKSDEATVKGNLKPQAEKNVTNFFVIMQVGLAEKIEVTDEMMEFEFAKMADQYGMEVSKIKEILCKDESSKARFVEDMRRQKIHQFLIENNQ